MSNLAAESEAPSDAELISRVRAGDAAAYGDLFERHRSAAQRMARQLVRGPDVDDLISEAFTKVLVVLQRGSGPDVAFRAYLLTAIRRLHVDKARAGQRVQVTDDLDTLDRDVEFADPATASFERGAAARAFASLPERWQLVLWHLEVEEQKPAEIAPLLGMSANSVAALAYRAREGLRQAYLQSHLADTADDSCRWTTEHLGAYVRGGLAKRDSTKVSGHLEECRRCTAVYLELGEVNSNLSGLLGPAILGAAAPGYLAAAGGTKLWLLLLTPWTKLKEAGTSVQAGAAAAAVTAVVGIAVAAGLVGGGDEPASSAGPQPSQQPAPNEPPPDDSAPPADNPPADKPSEPADDPPDAPAEEPPEKKPPEDEPEKDPPDKTAPDAPTEFDGAVSGSEVTLQWSPVPGARGYRVYRSAENAASFTTVAMSSTVSAAPYTAAAPGDLITDGLITETSYRDRSLVDGQRYRYVVTAVDEEGQESQVSKPVTVTYDPGPGTPTRLRAGERATGISLRWTPNTEPDIDGYRVYRDGRPVGGTTTTARLLDAEVTDGDSYEYTVAAVDRAGHESTRSSAVSATYDPVPRTPSDVTADVRADTVALRWDRNTEPDLRTYLVYRDGTSLGRTTSPRFVDADVTDGETYAYEVVAVDRTGQESPRSAVESATYDPVPASPTGVAAVAGDGEIDLSWDANAEPDIDGYVVLRDGDPITDPIGSRDFTDTDVEDGTTYRYTVVAVDRSGNESTPSDAVREAWDPAPEAPTGLGAEEQDDGIALTWDENAEPDLRSYRVYRDGEPLATVDEPSYDDTDVTDGQTYEYSVVAIDRGGQESDLSESVAEDYDPAPATPTNLEARVHGHSVSLTWNANSEPDVEGYEVYRDGAYVTTVGEPRFTDAPVFKDTSYAVSAVDASGQESDTTDPVEADVPPACPTGVIAVAGHARINVLWHRSVEADVAGYIVLRNGRAITGVTSSTRIVDRNVVEGLAYTYTVVAVDETGNRSEPSAAVTESWDIAPSMPTGLDWELNGTVLTLSWTSNPEPDVAYYRVRLDHESLGRVRGTSVRQDGHTGRYTHVLKVTAVDDSGNASKTAMLTFTHPDDRIRSFRVVPDTDHVPQQRPQRPEIPRGSLEGFDLR
ncbi:MAG: sigma-70 family RNA polymerase sigma factor [Nocardioidaceae bacterium]